MLKTVKLAMIYYWNLNELNEKGLVLKTQKRQGFNQMIQIYDLDPEMGKKIGAKKRGLLGTKKTKLTAPVKNLRNWFRCTNNQILN